ncbi:MAG: site-specific integrase [Gemmatimonadota bacterium]
MGAHLDGFVDWLRRHGYPDCQIRMRLRAAKRLDAQLLREGVRLQDLSAAGLLAYAPADAHDNKGLAALVRSLVRYFEEQGLLAATPVTPTDTLMAQYRAYLERLRGLSVATLAAHDRTVGEFLAFLRYDQVPERLTNLHPESIERFIQIEGRRQSRATLQHTVAHIRSFLRFLATSGLGRPSLDSRIDTPRLYRGERLPRALPWQTVQAFLRAIDRSTPMGRRDYAMLLLVATYGLRSCEVVALTLDDVEWRAGHLHVRRSKGGSFNVLPLTSEVGDALLDYLRHGRPAEPDRKIFLRVRAPVGPLKRTALADVFQAWVRRSGLPIPFQGAHCLRHSLAVHLLRQGTSLKAIGDLLGHRSAESTCVYLQLHVEDLREVSLPVPGAVGTELQP